MTSRLTSDARIPLVAHRDPVGDGDRHELEREPARGPAPLPWPVWPGRRGACCRGVTSFHELATATWGFDQSSSVMPTARSMARAGARSYPSVTSRLRRSMSRWWHTGRLGRPAKRWRKPWRAARRRSLGLLEPLDEEGLRRQHSPPHVAPGLGPGPRRQLRGAVAPPGGGGGAGGRRPPWTTSTTPSATPARNRPALPLLGPLEARRYIAEVRSRVLDTLDVRRPRRAAVAVGRVRLRDGRPARAPARRNHAGHPPAHGRRRLPARWPRRHPRPAIDVTGEVIVPARAVRHGHRRRAVGLRQRAAGPRGRPARIPHRHHPR